MIDCLPSLTPGGLSRTPKKEMHDMFVDTAVIYCITSLCEQTFVANFEPLFFRGSGISASDADFTII